MQLDNAVVLVTGANRGIGAEFVAQLKQRGAAKIYAASRDGAVDVEGVEAIRLDVTDPAQIEAVAAAAGDVQVLINNAGISTGTSVLSGDLAVVRREMDTNFWGPLLVTRAFTPALARAGGGAVVTVASVLAMTAFEGAGSYAASKAAAWSANDGIRLELAGQGTQVVTVFLASTDTDMMSGWDVFKNDPADVAAARLS